uniref:Uncharacterized protein n=1 Tax=Steinernema glaseri TaxID=37863 RepID=A0A1I8AA60_9BILA
RTSPRRPPSPRTPRSWSVRATSQSPRGSSWPSRPLWAPLIVAEEVQDNVL